MSLFDYDMRFFEAALERLEDYLLSPDLYWPLQIEARREEPPYLQLTPGQLLLTRRRLEATCHTAEQRARLSHLDERFEHLRHQWRSHWLRKAQADLERRLQQWETYLNEYLEKPSAHYDRYRYEVRRRAQIHLLAEALNTPTPHLEATLASLDRLLRSCFISGEFLWEPEVRPAFPPQEFWYLYGRLRPERIEAER